MPLKTLIASRLKPAAPVSLTSRPASGSPIRSRIDCTAFWKASPEPSPGWTGCTMIAEAPLGEKTGFCASRTSGWRSALSFSTVSSMRVLSASVSPPRRS